MKMTVLIENDPNNERQDLVAEFGLSLLFEHAGSTILFDTGTTGAFADNAARLGIDLGAVDVAVVSHHHFDHGGGLERFFAVNERAPVYICRGERVGRYFRAFGFIKRPIGIDLGLLDRFADRIVEISDTTEVAPGVTLLTDMGAGHPRPRGNRHLFVQSGRRLVPDPFDHELTMVLRDDGGMVVVTGCSHSGVLNMVDAAVEHFPDLPMKAIVGGFHLIGLPFYSSMAASRREVAEIGRALNDRCAGPIFTGHCTGRKALGVLESVLGDQLSRFPTGTVAEL